MTTAEMQANARKKRVRVVELFKQKPNITIFELEETLMREFGSRVTKGHLALLRTATARGMEDAADYQENELAKKLGATVRPKVRARILGACVCRC